MIETRLGALNVPELDALVVLNLELADRYQAVADDPDAEAEIRRTAHELATWRRSRARYFRVEYSRTDRIEASRAGSRRPE